MVRGLWPLFRAWESRVRRQKQTGVTIINSYSKQHQTQETLIASGQMAVKVYVCINDLSLGEHQKNFSQHLSILEPFSMMF